MLIIIPIFNHYNWVFKVARSQISSLYVTRSWGVKLCRQMPMQLWSPAKQLRKTKTWAAVHHLFDLTPVCRVRAHSWGHCSLLQILRENVCSNRSKLVWSSQETVRKQKSQQMETINTQKERLVLTRIYRTLSQSKPWSHTHSLKGSAVQVHSSLCSSLWDVGMPSGTWLQCYLLMECSVFLWCRNDRNSKQSSRKASEHSFPLPPLYWRTQVTQTLCAQRQQRDTVVPHRWWSGLTSENVALRCQTP